MKVFFLIFAFVAGVLCAYHNHTPPTIEQCEIVTLGEMARPIDTEAVYWIRKYNPKISEDTAIELFHHIEKTVNRYHSDANYDKGVARAVTPRLIVALILKESGFHWSAISDHGAIGLCQVMPLHLEDLEKAGIGTDLLDAEVNIEAGVHILMGYARRVDSVLKALSFYNAGPSRWRAGRGYARAVLKLYLEMEG